jgi:hypothetical protein
MKTACVIMIMEKSEDVRIQSFLLPNIIERCRKKRIYRSYTAEGFSVSGLEPIYFVYF